MVQKKPEICIINLVNVLNDEQQEEVIQDFINNLKKFLWN